MPTTQQLASDEDRRWPRGEISLLAVACGLLGLGLVILAPPSGARHFLRSPEPLIDLESEFLGARLHDGVLVVEAATSGSTTIARHRFQPEPDTDYLLEVGVEASDGARLLLSATGYVARERTAIVPPGTGTYRYILASGSPPGNVHLRIRNTSSKDLRVTHLALFEVRPSFVGLRYAMLMAAVALLVLLAVRIGGRRAALGTSLFLFCWTIYTPLTVPGDYNYLDSWFYVPTALSILRDGDTELSEFREWPRGRGSYRIRQHEGGFYNYYPIGTSVVALPVIALGSLVHRGEPDRDRRLRAISELTADVLAAASVAVLFLVACEMTAGLLAPMAMALLFAFGTLHMATHAGGLWSHNLSTLLTLLACWLAVRRAGAAAWLSALPLALACMTRPTSALFAPVLGLYILLRYRGQTARWAALFVAALTPFAIWSLQLWGRVLPPYYGRHMGALSLESVLEALAGHLISPNRGLLVFTPVFLLSLVGASLTLRRGSDLHPLYRYLAGLVVLYWLLLSTFNIWWGGGSYGPRLFAETFPIFTLLLYPLFASLRQATRGLRVAVATIAVVLSLFGLYTSYRGATSRATMTWNQRTHRNTSHFWDWSDMQIFHEGRRAQTDDPAP